MVNENTPQKIKGCLYSFDEQLYMAADEEIEYNTNR